MMPWKALFRWAVRATAIVAVLALAGVLSISPSTAGAGSSAREPRSRRRRETGQLEDRKKSVFWPNTIECVSYSIVWARGPHPDFSETLLSPSVVYDHGVLPCTMLRSAVEAETRQSGATTRAICTAI